MCVVVFVYSVMLSWLVSDATAEAAKATTVTVQHIQRCTATTAALNDNVEDVRLNAVWYCAACRSTIDDDDRSVTCDSCLQWHHIRYVALKIAPKAR